MNCASKSLYRLRSSSSRPPLPALATLAAAAAVALRCAWAAAGAVVARPGALRSSRAPSLSLLLVVERRPFRQQQHRSIVDVVVAAAARSSSSTTKPSKPRAPPLSSPWDIPCYSPPTSSEIMAPKKTNSAARKKRKAKSESDTESGSSDDDAGPGAGASGQEAKRKVEARVNPSRVRLLSERAPATTSTGGPVVLWMSRDQRLDDNWALLFAAQLAAAGGVDPSSPAAPPVPLAVAFNLVPAFLGAGARQFGFMLRGLKELEARLVEVSQGKVAFFLLEGDPTDTLPALATSLKASAVVSDFSPLRLSRAWKRGVAEKLPQACSFYEVDAHNVVPCWAATDKREVGARTLRPKIHRHLPEFLTEFPATAAALSSLPSWSSRTSLQQPVKPEWDAVISRAVAAGAAVPEVLWIRPGATAASRALAAFLEPSRLRKYATRRNDPCDTTAQSNLSPYLHFGQLAAQRAALEAAKHRGSSSTRESVEAFLEELVVRKELSDNFCHFEPDGYDSLDGAAAWARESLELHSSDPREFTYSREQLENAQTHDELWNASQKQLVHLGKMHGFMRMYWCKKILEWSARPSEALATAIYLNDRYELDGRDPSGYVGCMWSICGTHDMGWTERPIFGKIRFMNYNGCKRKFDIAGYERLVEREVAAEEERRKRNAPADAGGSGR